MLPGTDSRAILQMLASKDPLLIFCRRFMSGVYAVKVLTSLTTGASSESSASLQVSVDEINDPSGAMLNLENQLSAMKVSKVSSKRGMQVRRWIKMSFRTSKALSLVTTSYEAPPDFNLPSSVFRRPARCSSISFFTWNTQQNRAWWTMKNNGKLEFLMTSIYKLPKRQKIPECQKIVSPSCDES